MTATNPRRNKARGANDERDVARIIGGVRHVADTGGPEDILHPEFAIQCKGGKEVVTEAMRVGLQSARMAAVGTTKLPAVTLVDRRGTRVQRWICFPLEEFAAYHGYGGGA
jgi:hypothetical protein